MHLINQIRKLKSLFVISCVALVAQIAYSAEPRWVVVDDSSDTKTAIDEGSISRVGDIGSARNARFNADGSVFLVYQEYNCGSDEVRITRFLETSATGVSREEALGDEAKQWLKVPQGSVLHTMFETVCHR